MHKNLVINLFVANVLFLSGISAYTVPVRGSFIDVSIPYTVSVSESIVIRFKGEMCVCILYFTIDFSAGV